MQISGAPADSPLQFVRYQNDNSLSYAEYGNKNGFPILIQHGLIASVRDSHLFSELIQLGTRLICVARPGYGDSTPYLMQNMAEWGNIVSALVEKLELAQFDVFGISSGAPYSYALGAGFPDQVRNIFILSGIPALYDEHVLSFWHYPVSKNANMDDMSKLARELFFSNLAQADLEQHDIQDSMQNNGFGVAQDLRIRSKDWGFRLPAIKAPVYMQHSRFDTAVPFSAAQATADLIPKCVFTTRQDDIHFSYELLNDFIKTTMASHYQKQFVI